MTTWYQVYETNSVYGFKANETVILDHPDRRYIGVTLEWFKRNLPAGIKQISKIADLCE